MVQVIALCGLAALAWSAAALPVLAQAPPQAPPSTTVETRDYVVVVDGKPAGEYHLIVTTAPDGRLTAAGQADVRVRHLFGTYTYTYRGVESWPNGRLESIKCDSNDDGKRVTIAAVTRAAETQLSVNGQNRAASAAAWTTSFWGLPPAAVRSQPTIPTLDVDTGQVMQVKLTDRGAVQLEIAGRAVPCRHYQASGGAQALLWYDPSERLVKQTTVEDGHQTELRLTRVRSEPAR